MRQGQHQDPYDPVWHRDTAMFARTLTTPNRVTEMRQIAEKMYDDRDNQKVSYEYFQDTLAKFRAYERDPRCREQDPLLIDSLLLQIAAFLKYARPQTVVWLGRVHEDLTVIARRTKPIRQALLNVQAAPTLDFF